MIRQIGVKNFKSLKNILVNTGPLTLLAGLNGMGKSSLIQVLLMLKQSEEEAFGKHLHLKGSLADIGKGQDALYQFASEDTIELSLLMEDDKQFKWSFFCGPDQQLLQAKGSVERVYLPFLNFQYISAERTGPTDIHGMSQTHIDDGILGVKGEYAAHLLYTYGLKYKVNKGFERNKNSELTLMNRVNAWLGKISPGVKLNVVEVPDTDKIILNYQFDLGRGRTASFRPGNVGFGISYVLSIVVALLATEVEKDPIIIIENPESHIHPKGQAELGKLMALAASCGAQLFIETHSDHIINGVRVAIKEGLIDNKDVNCAYFTKKTTKDEQYTEIMEIKVDKQGELSDYPKDFLDEWNNQLLKLV